MKKRIFLIDKDPTIVEVITIILEGDGYEVILGEKPFNILQLISSAPSAIVLHNGLNNEGIKICQEIKDNPLTNTIPVIMSSTHPNLPEIATSCKADAYIIKPFDIYELSDLIESVIRKANSALSS